MNNKVAPSIIKMADEQLNQLLTEVKETVAENVKQNNFGVTDLWNIQRNKKPALRAKLTNRWHL
ncbi:MAG: hypothetical protein H7101_12090 [Deinococcales bacterium]|nr:hypothetical protein [Chitinophagaceae bacterium]